MPSPTKKVYFPGLNGLRFFAAFAVIFTHIELIKMSFGVQNHWHNPIFFNLGGLGVYFFFVLSGFLITYLLLVEKDVSGTISVKKFYLRRIFRIWPLYYLIFIIGFVILPFFHSIDIGYLTNTFHEHFWSQFLTYLLLFPNLGYALHGAVPHIGQLWTIGVEEQFYILWPLLIKITRKPLTLLIGLIVILVLTKIFVLYSFLVHPDVVWLSALKEFMAMMKIECMAVGGIGAYLLFKKNSYWLRIVYNQAIHIICWLLIPALIYLTPSALQDGIHLVYSIIFIVIILNISTNTKSFVKMNNKVLETLGSLSYGIYMYHLMLIPIVLYLFQSLALDPGENIFTNILFYFVVIASTIGISYISYYYLENYFLKLKKKFSIIQSAGK